MIFGVIATVIVAYVIYTLVTSYGSEYSDTSFDAFVIKAGLNEQGCMALRLLEVVIICVLLVNMTFVETLLNRCLHNMV
jgi:hypothetical protein